MFFLNHEDWRLWRQSAKFSDKMSNNVEYKQPTKIKIDYSSIQGIGVFATQDIPKGELIERCPMVKLEWRSKYLHDPTIWKYCYSQPKCQCSDCKNHGHYFWMVLGYGMIYNHQDEPNTIWKFKYKEAYADVISTKDIPAKEEIFVSYGSSYFKNKKKITLPPSSPNNQPIYTDENIEALEDQEFLNHMKKLMNE